MSDGRRYVWLVAFIRPTTFRQKLKKALYSDRKKPALIGNPILVVTENVGTVDYC